jgi:hypothetical protein
MRLKTLIRDCLYLNWALPTQGLPPLPSPLRYEVLSGSRGDFVLASALLFRQEGMRQEGVPFPRLSFPQFNLRLYVLDQDGVPSVFFVAVFVPAWLVPGARLLARQPARAARLRFPVTGTGEREWRVDSGATLRCRATPGPPPRPSEDLFPSWSATVDYVRPRTRGYIARHHSLARVEAEHAPVDAVPMRAEVLQDGLLQRLLGAEAWRDLHSAWLCPEMPMLFDFESDTGVEMAARAPVPG